MNNKTIPVVLMLFFILCYVTYFYASVVFPLTSTFHLSQAPNESLPQYSSMEKAVNECTIQGTNYTFLGILRIYNRKPLVYPMFTGPESVRPLELTKEEKQKVQATGQNRSSSARSLYYNRVPKCGSHGMVDLLKRLSKRNKFNFQGGTPSRHMVTEREEADIAEKVAKNPDTLFQRHVFYPDFIKHGVQVDLVNMVREPVARMVSRFYYSRLGNRWGGRRKTIPKDWFSKSISSCALGEDKECWMGWCYQEMMMSFLCGNHPQCSNSTNRMALQRAMYNVEHRYTVVGVLEQFNSSLTVMEHYLPRWFKGAVELIPEKHPNSHKHEEPSEEAAKVLGQRLSLEIELYDFIKQRLQIQLSMI